MLLIYSSIRSLVICKYRDSNMFGNHFRILNARMVQSVESVWTVLYIHSIHKAIPGYGSYKNPLYLESGNISLWSHLNHRPPRPTTNEVFRIFNPENVSFNVGWMFSVLKRLFSPRKTRFVHSLFKVICVYIWF